MIGDRYFRHERVSKQNRAGGRLLSFKKINTVEGSFFPKLQYDLPPFQRPKSMTV